METQVNPTRAITPRSVGIKFGLLSALIVVVFFLIAVVMGENPFDSNFNWRSVASIVMSVAIIVLAHKNFKDNGDGYMSYGQGVGISFWIALVSVAISTLITFAYVKLIDPASMDLFTEQQTEEMAARGMSDEQIEMGLGVARIFIWPMYVFMGLLFGVLFGLIVSIFTQKKNPQPAF